VRAPSNKRCRSRRKFGIRIRELGSIQIDKATVYLNKKRLKVVKRKVSTPISQPHRPGLSPR
jgi:hypothetical protein